MLPLPPPSLLSFPPLPQVRDIYFDSGLALTEIVFCLAAQTGLNLEDSKRLLAYFRERDVVAASADGALGTRK